MGAGLGDASVFGGTFEDESFCIKHQGAGDVGMASTGPHSNACQFYISVDKLEWLDNQKMVFGKVVDGLKAVKAMGKASVAAWNQKPKLTHYVAACGKLTPQMVLDKRTALHSGVAAASSAAAGAAAVPDAGNADKGGAGPPAEVLTLADDAGQPAAADAPPAQEEEEGKTEIFDINSYDDDAKKAALKMQQCGRGMLARKHAKKQLDFKFSEVVSDVSADRLWEVSSEAPRACLFLALLPPELVSSSPAPCAPPSSCLPLHSESPSCDPRTVSPHSTHAMPCRTLLTHARA